MQGAPDPSAAPAPPVADTGTGDDLENELREIIPPPPEELAFSDEEFNRFVDLSVDIYRLEAEIHDRDQQGESRSDLEPEYLQRLRSLFDRHDISSDKYLKLDAAVYASEELGAMFEERVQERHPDIIGSRQ